MTDSTVKLDFLQRQVAVVQQRQQIDSLESELTLHRWDQAIEKLLFGR